MELVSNRGVAMAEITSPAPTVAPWASDLVRSLEDEAVRTTVSGSFLEFEIGQRILARSPADQAEVGAAILFASSISATNANTIAVSGLDPYFSQNLQAVC